MVPSALDVAYVECTRCAGVVLNSGKMAEAVSSGKVIRDVEATTVDCGNVGLRGRTEYYEDTAVEMM